MNVAVKPSKHTAPGQYLGYSLQPVRLCFHLLTGPSGARVSIEHVDDVAVHHHDGSIEFEQTKSALSGNPISNFSDDLWKTIWIWIEKISADADLLSKAKFTLYIAPAHQGEWATLLNDASTSDAVDSLVATIQGALRKRKKPPACHAYISAFLSMDPNLRLEFVRRLSVISTDDDPLEPIRRVYQRSVGPELLDLICAHAIGVAKERADALIRAEKAAILDAGVFQAEMKAFIRTNNLPNLLVSVAKAPAPAEVAELLSDRPVFVRQLELIEASPEQQVRSVSDYLRSAADKARWAEAGIIFQHDIESWDDDLLRRYEFVRSEIEDLNKTAAAVLRGRLIYARCAQAEVKMTGREVPGHFVHGSYTHLSDALSLGWHEDFKTLLGGSE